MCHGKLRYQNKTSQSGNLLKKDYIPKVLRLKTEQAKTKIDIKELIRYVETIYKMEFDSVFTTPEV